jgi:hypothetical protein
MRASLSILAVCTVLHLAGCAVTPKTEVTHHDDDIVPINVNKAAGDIIQRQEIVQSTTSSDALPRSLYAVGALGSLLAGYVTWLVRHHRSRRV